VWTSTVRDIEFVVKQQNRLLTIQETATVTEVAKKMSDNHVGCLLVFDTANKFVGVLTERDIIAKVFKKSSSFDAVLARDIMTTDAISCTMDTPISEVERLMDEHKIRHVPVVEKGVPAAMVSSRDIIAYQLHSNQAMKTAAEQVAMLSTGLKSLDFDDVVALAINEVPKNFGADWAVLYFTQNGLAAPLIYRKGCPVPEEILLNPRRTPQLASDGKPMCDKICADCKKFGGQAPALIIPLTICERFGSRSGNTDRQGFLCMCRLNELAGEDTLQLYKASLLQEVLDVNLTNARLYQSYRKAQRDSEIDPLTGVASRRVLEQMLNAEFARAVRYNHGFSVAILDVDNFKTINDTTGHSAGDRTLQLLAKSMRRNARANDTIARYGGDEFVMLLPETKLSDAAEMLERIRSQVEKLSLPNIQSITISCGLTEWTGSVTDTPENILKRADAALYEAKRKGRNCVAVDEPAKNPT
jgi:diguanylate cyclase (GGDEF)-like protein